MKPISTFFSSPRVVTRMIGVDHVPSLRRSSRQLCQTLGGTPLDACPTANLVGICWTVSAMPETWDTFYYDASSPSASQQSCEASQGTWRTTP